MTAADPLPYSLKVQAEAEKKVLTSLAPLCVMEQNRLKRGKKGHTQKSIGNTPAYTPTNIN